MRRSIRICELLTPKGEWRSWPRTLLVTKGISEKLFTVFRPPVEVMKFAVSYMRMYPPRPSLSGRKIEPAAFSSPPLNVREELPVELGVCQSAR
ncbi:Uncharacterised protein [uncultured archaeon]|nr:Uncharacterised protein [uncultured archaeon]